MLSKDQIIRAWRDESYRNSLSEEERGQLPESPAGVTELDDSQLEGVAGGTFDLTDLFEEGECSLDSGVFDPDAEGGGGETLG